MKKYLYTLILLMGLSGFAYANSKVTALTENTTPISTDIIYLVDAPGTNPKSQKVTATNLITKAHGLGNGMVEVAAGTMGIATAGTDYATGDSTNTFTNKTIDADGTGNSITNIENADIKAAAAIAATKIADGTVTNAEFQYINSLSSNAQTQLDVRCLESVLGTSIGTGLLLDGTTLKVSAILQEYHAVDPTAFGLTMLDDADGAAVRTTIGAEATAVDEAYASGWNADTGCPQKDDVYDYLHGFDTNDDGSFTDETWFTGRSRFTEDVTIQTFTDPDTSPDVTNGTSDVVNLWRSAGTSTITDFDDGDDHSEFTDGDWFILLFNTAVVIDCSDNANIKGHGNNNFTGAAGIWALVVYDDTNNYWVFKPSETKSANFATLRIPNDESADKALANLGEVHVRGDEDSVNLHLGAGGEIAGEASISAVQHISFPFSAEFIYDTETTNRTAKLMTLDNSYPNGIIIDEWLLEASKDPTTELNIDLFYSAVANWKSINPATDTLIDVLDTTAGVSSEDTDGNINTDGSAIPTAAIIYIRLGADPVDSDVLYTLELWYHLEAD